MSRDEAATQPADRPSSFPWACTESTANSGALRASESLGHPRDPVRTDHHRERKWLPGWPVAMGLPAHGRSGVGRDDQHTRWASHPRAQRHRVVRPGERVFAHLGRAEPRRRCRTPARFAQQHDQVGVVLGRRHRGQCPRFRRGPRSTPASEFRARRAASLPASEGRLRNSVTNDSCSSEAIDPAPRPRPPCPPPIGTPAHEAMYREGLTSKLENSKTGLRLWLSAPSSAGCSARREARNQPLQAPVRNPGRHAPRVNHRLHIDHHPALLHHREQGPLQQLQILPMRHRQHHGGQVLELLQRRQRHPVLLVAPGASSCRTASALPECRARGCSSSPGRSP